MAHSLAGKLAPKSILPDVPALVSAYYTTTPDVADPAQRVAFGTSGHRGSSTKGSFNEAHIAAIAQAICEYRAAEGITGPLYVGKDTHALSTPAERTAIEVFVANDVTVLCTEGYAPTPAVSHAILAHNRGAARKADGVVITPSHNP
ncbi:MAG: phosphoglucomutase, alpha-D-glucose phosphate-specific, partial [Myxococcales bacterium]|nr:phosphoglucomutase, alpha-D-glucose phosphate-specific [Myxococcales bacterium]